MTKTDSIIINNARFLSMVAIIYLHSFFYQLSPGPDLFQADFFQLIFGCVLKFGTICFFIISGYLLGHKLDHYSSIEFFHRRLKVVAKPWLFWSFFLSVGYFVNSLIRESDFEIYKMIFYVLFESEYWFIPNYFMALLFLVLFSKVNSIISGTIFFALSIAYGVNIYAKIIPTVHTTAVFGYIFFLWFGREVKLNRITWIRWLMSATHGKIVFLTLLALGLSIVESIYLKTKIGVDYDLGGYRVDPLNTLKISNQAYGVLFFCTIYKIKHAIYPKWIQPQYETFGLYLSHWVIMLFFKNILTKILSEIYKVSPHEFLVTRHQYYEFMDAGLISLVFFFILYNTTLIFVKGVKKTKFSWIVGKV